MNPALPSKDEVVRDLIDLVREQVEAAEKALSEARAGISSGDERARNRGERGVIQEKAWLMSALEERLGSLDRKLNLLKQEKHPASDAAGRGSLVALEFEETGRQVGFFFIHPDLGGETVTVGGLKVVAVSPQAPVGRALMGKAMDDEVEIRLEDKVRRAIVTGLK